MFTTPMVQSLAVILDRDVDRVTEKLLEQGVMHFLNVSEVKAKWADRIQTLNPKQSFIRIAEIRKRIESLLGPVEFQSGKNRRFAGEGKPDERSMGEQHPSGTALIPEELELKDRKLLNLDEENKKLDRISDELKHISERQRLIQQEIDSFEEIKKQIKLHGAGLPDITAGRYSFIAILIGSLPAGNVDALKNKLVETPSVLIPLTRNDDMSQYLIVTMKRDSERVEGILTKYGWRDDQISHETVDIKADVSGDLDSKIANLHSEYKKLKTAEHTLIERNRNELIYMWQQLRMNELFYKIQAYFKRTSKTVVFSGWLPSAQKTAFIENISNATEGRCYIEWHGPKESEEGGEKFKPPVQFHNPKIMTPFQMLVANYGVPEYGTVDPTPFVMLAYLVMFGLMFSDVGQGAVLVLLGYLGTLFLKGKKEGLRNLSKLIIWCGLSSIVAGFLFGSYFGMGWIRPVWFDFHGILSGYPHKQSFVKDIFDILTISLYFGISVIGVGLIFNWINLFRKRRWGNLILDKGGLVGGWIFGGGIYTARYLVSHGYKDLPQLSLLFVFVGIPAILLFLKQPILFSLYRRDGGKKPFTVFTPLNFIMEGIVDLLEVFSGYLSNTLSFMRVAGLGIAHVSLMTAFFEIARMASTGSTAQYNIWSILILICGNVLVIGLEGLSAGVQSLRLNYYEFFTKFFSGSGEIYSPVSLRSRDK